MFEVLYELFATHELWLVAAALALGVFVAVTGVTNARRALASARGKIGWVCASALVLALGGWGVAFVLLMAYTPEFSIRYDLGAQVSALSLFTIISALGISHIVWSNYRFSPVISGSLASLGAFIASTVMLTSMRSTVELDWDSNRLTLALALGTPLMILATHAVRDVSGKRGNALASLAFIAAFAVYHFTGLTAADFPGVYDGAPTKPTAASAFLAVTVMLALVPFLALALGVALFDRHIGERRKAEEARLNALVNASSEGLALLQDKRIVEVNDRFVEMVGLDRSDLVGTPLCKIAHDAESVSAIRSVAPEESQTCRLRSRTGPTITAQISTRMVDFMGEQAQLIAFRDISTEERARARIMHMANHDTLTGLPNRLCFRERLEEELARSWKEHTLVALMFFDLDRFKEVNDVHGHATGDDLLVAVAGRMLDALPKEAIAARLSGDEFAVILPDVQNRLDAITTAERVVTNVGSPITLGSVHMNVSASGGVTVFPLDGEDMDCLMNQADLALYRAKHQGRNCVCDFDPQMGRQMQERRELESDLALAIEDELLDLHFQPQASLGTGRVVGFEALVRWNDERRGFVPPSEFIQLAEESGQILKLGRWVIEHACREAVNWPENTRVSVNVSPAQFRQGNVILTIERALKTTGLDPSRLEIEITEGVLIDDESRALTLLRRLKEIGVGLAIDDFGTGYASLNYLRAFPFDKIKIDRAFMSGIQNQPEAQIIVKSTIDLAHQLGMRVVVEGIEELDELIALGEQPDVVLQGYLLSRPVTRGQIPDMLATTPDFFTTMNEIAAGRRSA